MILGGGASGLSLSLLTGAQIIESERTPGGHAVSTEIDGYTFDRGPHIIFSRSKLLLECMVNSLGTNVHESTRNNKVFVRGKLLKYPIENDLAGLSQSDKIKCLIGYVEAQIANAGGLRQTRDLADWFNNSFGIDLTELYFRPYNEKVWKVPLENLSMTWSERIPRPPLEDVVRSAMGEKTEGYVHQLHYHYPLNGGYSALMRAWAMAIDPKLLNLDEAVLKIEPINGGLQVVTSKGMRTAKRIVSTIPLSHLPELMPEMPIAVIQAISRLRTNSTITVTVAFKVTDLNQWTAVYLPEVDYLPNRISFPTVFSPRNSPVGQFLVQAEITSPSLDNFRDMNDQRLIDHVVHGLRLNKLVSDEAEFVTAFVERYQLAYVVYTKGFEDDLALVVDWAKSLGIFLHGRFGSHNYLNVDGCLEQSIGLARQLGNGWTDEDLVKRFTQIGEV